MIAGCDLLQIAHWLVQNGTDSGGVFGAGHLAELLRRDSRERDPTAFQPADEFSGKRRREQSLAVEQRLYDKPVIDRLDEVARAFDKEELAVIAIAAVDLKPRNRCQDQRSF